MMIDPRLMDTWFRFMSEAARNATTAQDRFDSLANVSTPEEFARRMTQFAAGASPALDEQELMRLWEDWWRAMGFVPRTRYLDLLEENDALRRQLREAKQTIERLRNTEHTTEKTAAQVQQASQAWESVFQQMLDAQSQWMQTWGEQRTQPEAQTADDENQPPDPTEAQD